MLYQDVRSSTPSLLSKTCTKPLCYKYISFLFRAYPLSSNYLRTSFLSLGTIVGKPLSFSFTGFAVIQIFKMSGQPWVWDAATGQYAWRPETVAPPGYYMYSVCRPEENSGPAHPVSYSQEHPAPGLAASDLRGTRTDMPVSNLSAIYTPNSELSSVSNLD